MERTGRVPVALKISPYALETAGRPTCNKAFVTFVLDFYPTAGTTLVGAEYRLRMSRVGGNPFGELGDLTIERMAFEQIGANAFGFPGLGSVGVLAAKGSSGDVVTLDVTAALTADLNDRAAREDRNQYRMSFITPATADDNGDVLDLDFSDIHLDVVYLIP